MNSWSGESSGLKATEVDRLKIILFRSNILKKKKKVFLNPFCHLTTNIYYIYLEEADILVIIIKAKVTNFVINNYHSSISNGY